MLNRPELQELGDLGEGATTDDILQDLLATGEELTPDFALYCSWLDDIAPVTARFTITNTPVDGVAPEVIRRQWVGVDLPIRGGLDTSKGVTIFAREALASLRPRSPDAFEWWQMYFADLGAKILPFADPAGCPEFYSNIDFLTFGLAAGEIELA